MSSVGNVGQTPGEWDLPTPLPGRTDPLPTDAAGPVLGPLADAIAAALHVPADMVVTLALPLITTAAHGSWRIEVQPGWTEPLCLATLVALPSGERKSPTLRLLDQPLREVERETQAAKRPEIAQQAARRRLAEGKVEELRKKAIKGLDDGGIEREYLAEVAKLEQLTVDPLPRWLTDDATPEATVSLLAEQGAVGSVSAEPGLFGVLAGRYSSGSPNLEWLLKATSGEALIVDRIGRDPERVEHPAFSVTCCIQPGRLVELSSVRAFRESGLLARWIYAVPASQVGARGATREVEMAAIAAWADRLATLARDGWKRHEAGEVATVRLSDQARARLENFRAALEPHLHPGHGRYAGIADWVNKLPGSAVRIAGAFTLLADSDAVEVTEPIMDDAIRLATGYISHAIAAFGMTRPSAEGYSQAKQVLAMFGRLAVENGGEAVSKRAIHRKLGDRSWVESSEALDRPLAILVDHGFIRPQPKEGGKQGRPSERYLVHPAYLQTLTDETDTTPLGVAS